MIGPLPPTHKPASPLEVSVFLLSLSLVPLSIVMFCHCLSLSQQQLCGSILKCNQRRSDPGKEDCYLLPLYQLVQGSNHHLRSQFSPKGIGVKALVQGQEIFGF